MTDQNNWIEASSQNLPKKCCRKNTFIYRTNYGNVENTQ